MQDAFPGQLQFVRKPCIPANALFRYVPDSHCRNGRSLQWPPCIHNPCRPLDCHKLQHARTGPIQFAHKLCIPANVQFRYAPIVDRRNGLYPFRLHSRSIHTLLGCCKQPDAPRHLQPSAYMLCIPANVQFRYVPIVFRRNGLYPFRLHSRSIHTLLGCCKQPDAPRHLHPSAYMLCIPANVQFRYVPIVFRRNGLYPFRLHSRSIHTLLGCCKQHNVRPGQM